MELRAPAGGVLVVPMSREEFDALHEIPHTEWWDGACVVTGGTTYRHARTITAVSALLNVALRGRDLDVLAGAGWRLPDAEFAPDIAVVAPGPPDELLSSPPLLVVEVLSRSTRHIDLDRNVSGEECPDRVRRPVHWEAPTTDPLPRITLARSPAGASWRRPSHSRSQP